MRYSPKPIEDYGRFIRGEFVGPSASRLLSGDPERWNLAFLSFDYDARPVPADPQFTSLILKTVGTRLDTGAFDAIERNKPVLVRGLLQMPAPQFVRVIEFHPLLKQLPIYQARGDEWLATIKARSWLCGTHDSDEVDDPESLEQAQQLLAAISQRK